MNKIEKMLSSINEIEALASGSSWVHKLLPITKVLLMLTFIIAVISFNRYEIIGLLPMFIYPVGMCLLAKISIKKLFVKTAVALPFVFFVGLSNILTDEVYGYITCSSLIIKTVLTVSMALLTISTTELIHVCSAMISLKVPRIFAVQFLLCYRYISVLLMETNSMLTAYHLRSALKQKGIEFKDFGSFVGNLIIKSYLRAERIYDAMKCRGFTGDLFMHADKIDKQNYTIMIVGVILIVIARIWRNIL